MATYQSFDILDDDTEIGLEELIAASGLERDAIVELVEFEAIPARGRAGAWVFSARCIVQARRAARLRADFGLNTPGMALALTYLERIETLERRLRELECQLLR